MQRKQFLAAVLLVAMFASMMAVPVRAEDTIVPCGKNAGCILQDGHSEECEVPQQTPDCTCADKCAEGAENADCALCAAAEAAALSDVCIGMEAADTLCDAEGCELIKGHPGEHTAAGNFVACDGSVTPDVCEATEHIPGCSKFAVKNTETLKAALQADLKEITVAEGFSLTETIVIPAEKDVSMDMAGKAITVGAGVNPAFRVLGKLTVKNGNMDTAKDDADGYCFIVGGSVNEEAFAGELIIESGTYRGAASVVSVTKGKASVRGGHFSAEPADGMEASIYVLNCIDANYRAGTATISVAGGTFDGFDPSNNLAEGENTNFLAESCCVSEQEESYTVGQHKRNHVAGVQPNCKADGNIEHWKCDHCGKLYDAADGGNVLTAESVVVTNGTHELEKQDAIAATCQADGVVEHWKCKHCAKLFDKAQDGKELSESEVIDTNRAHNLEKQEAVAATCQKDGHIEHYKCSVCNALFRDEAGTAALTEEDAKTTGTHDLKYQGGKKAAYDADGISPHYYCEVTGCGKTFADARGETELEESTVIPMLSHVEDGVLVIDEDAIANEGKKNVVLDLLQKQVMGELKAVTQVQFQLTCLKKHVEQGGTLKIQMSDGEVYFDNDALKTIVTKAQGSTVTLMMDEIAKTDSSLSVKQKTTLNDKKDPYIVRLELTSGGKRITDNFGGKVYVYLTEFTPKSGYSNSNYSAYYLKEDGATEAVSYYSREARITVEHFSEYFLSRNAKAASNPTTGDTSNVMVWAGVGLAAVAALVVLLVLNRKKQR